MANQCTSSVAGIGHAGGTVGVIAPRQGRFGKVGYALLAYIVYINLVAISRAQMEAGVLPLWVGFWWVHLLFLSIAIFLLYRRNRGLSLGKS